MAGALWTPEQVAAFSKNFINSLPNATRQASLNPDHLYLMAHKDTKRGEDYANRAWGHIEIEIARRVVFEHVVDCALQFPVRYCGIILATPPSATTKKIAGAFARALGEQQPKGYHDGHNFDYEAARVSPGG